MRVSAITLLVLGFVCAAFAQSDNAVIMGTVTDAQSLPIAQASVHFKALSTGAIRVVSTNDKGLFYAPALRPDDYELTTEANGFAPVTQTLHLEVGQKLAIDVSLKVGPVKEGIRVTAAAETLRPTDASVG